MVLITMEASRKAVPGSQLVIPEAEAASNISAKSETRLKQKHDSVWFFISNSAKHFLQSNVWKDNS